MPGRIYTGEDKFNIMVDDKCLMKWKDFCLTITIQDHIVFLFSFE